MNHSSKQTKKFNQTFFHSLKMLFIESGTSQLYFYVQVKCTIRLPILHFVNSHVDTTKIMFSSGRKFATYSWLVRYSLFITYSYASLLFVRILVYFGSLRFDSFRFVAFRNISFRFVAFRFRLVVQQNPGPVGIFKCGSRKEKYLGSVTI